MNGTTPGAGPGADRRLRVALVVGTLHIGGTEQQVVRLAAELRERGHEVRVFVQSAGGPLEAQLDAAGVPYKIYGFAGLPRLRGERRIHPARLVRSVRPLVELWLDLRRWDATVCHAFLPTAYLWSMIGATLGRVPLRIAGRRALALAGTRSLPNRLLFAVAESCTHVVTANGTAVARTAIEVDHVREDKVRVLPNGVDLPDRRAPVGDAPVEGLMIANLIPYKGHDVVLEALGSLADPPRVRFVGDGLARDALEAKAARLGLAERVAFAGSVPGAGALWEHAQFGILASFQEGFPNAILEAMSYGVPMVTTDAGGAAELVEDGVTGLVVPVGDSTALAKAIQAMVDDAEIRVSMGKAARGVAERYSWARCTDAHERLYLGQLAPRLRGVRHRSFR